jgi:hypothetical protein
MLSPSFGGDDGIALPKNAYPGQMLCKNDEALVRKEIEGCLVH